jgi:predicted nucleic acid-binding protein
MSAETALIDTNVLVYALFRQRAEHAASLALLESAQEPGANLVVAPQNLAEFSAVVTNPRRVSTPLPASAGRTEIEKLTSLRGLRILSVPADIVARHCSRAIP